MGIDYKHFVVPTPDGIELVPDAAAIGRVIRALIKHGLASEQPEDGDPFVEYAGIGPDAGRKKKSKGPHPIRIPLDLTEPEQALAKAMERPGILGAYLPVPLEASPGKGNRVLGRGLSETIFVSVLPSLGVFPCGVVGTGTIPCSKCKGEASISYEDPRLATAWYWKNADMVEQIGGIQQVLLPDCGSCGTRLDPKKLAGTFDHPEKGKKLKVKAPFSRFAVTFYTSGPIFSTKDAVAELHPKLFADLEAALSCSVRCLGFYSI